MGETMIIFIDQETLEDDELNGEDEGDDTERI